MIEMEIPEDIEEELESKGGIDQLLKNIEKLDVEERCKVYKALSNRLRLKILALLNEQDLCVCLLKEILKTEDSKLSYHISVLKDEGLIQGERNTNFVIYRLTEKGKRFAP